MSSRSTQVTVKSPGPAGWDFGDFPYGVEPLTLPHPGEPTAPEPAGTSDWGQAGLVLAEAARAEPRISPATTTEEIERLFWFRWITGHHMSFILWRLLADASAELAEGTGDPDALSHAIVEYAHGYSSMLLYTGSPTREVYNEVIRPSMARTHSAFSGTWSADYAAVRGLFRGRRLPPMAATDQAELTRELRMSHDIHLDVAARLVNEGGSLLQKSAADASIGRLRAWSALFDCYFLTLRAPVSAGEIAAQLVRRGKAITMDLATNGLYPETTQYPEGRPDERQTPEIRACGKGLIDTVRRVVTLASDAALRREG
jgi:L-tyrosine peroxygenase